MPGTIQVSVMDFQGPPSTSTPSTLLKVSLGKREYQTSDKGDFSFPLTNFRDNLFVKLLDAEGNEIVHTGIQPMSIVQKVSWDETFFFEGGGWVHLNIQFILNEEERTRIRLKREAALKKKQGNIPSVSEKYSDIASSTGSSVTSSLHADTQISGSLDKVNMEANLLPNPDIFPADPQSSYGKEGSILQQRRPKSTDEREGASSAPTVQGAEVHLLEAKQIANLKKLETESLLPDVHSYLVKEDSSRLVYSGSDVAETSSLIFLGQDDDHFEKSEQRVPVEKSPSNVRNLVTAFESSLAKDTKSSVKVPDVRSETKRVGKRGHLKDDAPKDFYELAKQSSGRHKDPFVAGDLKPNMGTSIERGKGADSAKRIVDNILNEMMKTSEKLMAAPNRSVENESSLRACPESPAQLERLSPEKATVSGRMHTDLFERDYSFRLSAEKRDSGGTLLAEGRGRTDSTKIDIQVASIEKSKSLDYYEEDLLYCENSGIWIFPNNTEQLCVTTAGKRVMNLIGSDPPEANSHHKKSSFSSGERRKEFTPHISEDDMQKNQKGSRSINDSSSGSSPDNASGGLFGQMLKIAIIVGFGVLVLMTRQREPRKSRRETDELLLTTSELMDEQSTIEE